MSYIEERAIKTIILREQRKRSPGKGIKGLIEGQLLT